MPVRVQRSDEKGQRLSRERLWSLHWGPETLVEGDGADWSVWRWLVASNEDVEVRAVSVYVAAAAMACAVGDLDKATAAARETLGRSAVEQMLDMPEPFAVVVCVRAGLHHQESPPRYGGHPASARPPDASSAEA